MNKKIPAIFLVAILIIINVLMAFGKVSLTSYWIVVICAGISAYIINKKL